MAEYDLTKTTGQCSVTGRPFEAGETFYSVVLETPDGLERRDICEQAWQGPPEGTLCHFKTRMPQKDEPKKTFVDDTVLVEVFCGLADAKEPTKLRFRFVLALILLRKRLLKYERTLRQADGEYWEMRLTGSKSRHRVFNPVMEEAEIQAVSGELGVILHDHALGEATDQEPPAVAEPPQASPDAAERAETEGAPH